MINTVKPKEAKKKVFFDTSFLVNIQQQKISVDINVDYPESEWIRAVQDTFLDEFWMPKSSQLRPKAMFFYEEKNLSILKDTSELLLQEFKCNSDELFLKEDILLFLKGEDIEQGKRENLYLSYYYDRLKSNKAMWFSIPISDDDKIEISTKEIYDQIGIITKDMPISIPLDSNGMFFLKIIRDKALLSRCDAISQEIKNITSLKQDLPLAYMVLIYSVFCNFLRRPKNVGERKNLTTKREPFSIFLDNDEIQLSENFLPDFRISLPTLCYGDLFVTSDKNQANLLKILYPEQSGKIRLIN